MSTTTVTHINQSRITESSSSQGGAHHAAFVARVGMARSLPEGAKHVHTYQSTQLAQGAVTLIEPGNLPSQRQNPWSLVDAYPSPPQLQSHIRVNVLDRWDGVVIEVDRETGVFVGEFSPEGERAPRMRADFLISEVDADDDELLRPGALFVVQSGFIRSARRRMSVSTIRFRRIPSFDAADIRAAVRYATSMRRELGLTDGDTDRTSAS